MTTIRSPKANRRAQAAPALSEKVRALLELQRAQFPRLSLERTLKSWEHPWDVEP